jgi:hypothetical protein
LRRVSVFSKEAVIVGALAVLATLLIEPAWAHAAPTTRGEISGWSVGTSTPPPLGAPRIPYAHQFLAGSPKIHKVSVRRIHGGRRSGRLDVRVLVQYPRLKRLPARVLSDRAVYRGRATITLRTRSRRRLSVSSTRRLPAAKAGQGGRALHEVVLPRRASRRAWGFGRRFNVRVRAVARFQQFGAGRPSDRAVGRAKRRVRLGHVRAGAFAEQPPSPWPCTYPGDIPGFDENGKGGVHTRYQTDNVIAHWATPIKIRLCEASDRPFNPNDWHLSDSTPHGQLRPIRVEDGYVTITWVPNPGPFQNVRDHIAIAVNGAGDQASQRDVWDFNVAQAPFTMRAMGDSITAGFGYMGDGKQAQGSDDFDAIVLNECLPLDQRTLNNRCSSNSDLGRNAEGFIGRWSADTGLSNNVAWPAQFANRHKIHADENGVVNYKPYRNWAVTGSSPENWLPGEKDTMFSGTLDQIVNADPDLTVLTAGANPILGRMLARKFVDGNKCGGFTPFGKEWQPKQAIEAGTKCIRDEMSKFDLYGRLRAIYRRLLEAPHNHIIVAPYPNVLPPMPLYVVTKFLVNDYPPYLGEWMGRVVNDEIRRAVTDEANWARRHGEGDRLTMMSPPRFGLGRQAYDQVIGGKPSVRCDTLQPRKPIEGVDGSSNQSAATQSALAGRICPSANRDHVYLESLDGVHLSRPGAEQYANALDQKVREEHIPVDGRGEYQAVAVSQQYPGALLPGERATATMMFRNVGTKALSREGPNPTRCRVSRPRDSASSWIDPAAANDVLGPHGELWGVKIDQGTVLSGDLFTCTFHLLAPNSAYGVYPQYFSPVTEDKAWMLPHDDVFLPLSIADAEHPVYPPEAYGAAYLGVSYPNAALAPGEKGIVQFTFRNIGTATLFNSGTNPTNCRPSNPMDRKSAWVSTATPIDQTRVGPGEKFTCTITVTAPSQVGKYNEYFAPVAEGKAWMFDDGVDDAFAPLASADADHVIWPPDDYSALLLDKSAPTRTFLPGQTGTVKLSFLNTSEATLYNTGTNPTNCRPSHPIDRQSAWVTKATPIDQTRVGSGAEFTCTIVVKAPRKSGSYDEYFSPVTEGKRWMFNNGKDDVFVTLKSG